MAVNNLYGRIVSTLNSISSTDLTVNSEFKFTDSTNMNIPSEGYLTIGDADDLAPSDLGDPPTYEKVKYTSFTRNGDGTTTFSGLSREQGNTEAIAWSAGVDVGLSFAPETLTRVLSNLYTNEKAQDAIGAIATGSGVATVTYNDVTPAIKIEVLESNISHDNISGVSAADHHARFTSEEAQDAAAAMITAGKHVTAAYDDVNNTLSIAVSISQDLDFGSSHKAINLVDPTNPQDAATKTYVDAIKQGLDIKDSIVAATDGTNIDLTLATDPNPIDGVTLSNGDRVLLKDQTTATENGIYEAVTAIDPTTWIRASDADEDSEITAGMFVFVEQGTNNSDKGFVLTTNDPISVGTTGLSFTQFSGAGQITAGDGLSKTGDTLNHEPASVHESGGALALTFGNLASVIGVSGIKMDTAANLIAGTADRLCLETDTGRVLYDNGASFIELGLSESQIGLGNLGSLDALGNSLTNQSTSWSDFNNLDLSNVSNSAQANFITVGQATVNLSAGDSLQLLRTHIPTGKAIKIIKAAVSQKDGTYGTAGLDIEVYNQTDLVTIYSFDASITTVEGLDDGSYASPLATGGTGDEIIIRISNNTGAAQDVQGWLKAVVE